MTIGLSLLSIPVWNVFYGSKSAYGADILKYFVFVALIISSYTALVSIVQVLKYYKEVLISLVVGVCLKLGLNVFLINLFAKLGFVPVYGSITATIIGYGVGIILCLFFLKKKCDVKYSDTLKILWKIALANLAMIVVILLFKFIIPMNVTRRLLNIPIIIVYTLLGAGTYFLISKKLNLFDEVFDKEFMDKIMSKIKR